jgi:hypothetical protein
MSKDIGRGLPTVLPAAAAVALQQGARWVASPGRNGRNNHWQQQSVDDEVESRPHHTNKTLPAHRLTALS